MHTKNILQYIDILNQPYCIVLRQKILQYSNISIYCCISTVSLLGFYDVLPPVKLVDSKVTEDLPSGKLSCFK